MTALLTIAEVVAMLPVSRATFFRTTRHDPTFPAPILIGKRNVWREDQVREWLGRRKEETMFKKHIYRSGELESMIDYPEGFRFGDNEGDEAIFDREWNRLKAEGAPSARFAEWEDHYEELLENAYMVRNPIPPAPDFTNGFDAAFRTFLQATHMEVLFADEGKAMEMVIRFNGFKADY